MDEATTTPKRYPDQHGGSNYSFANNSTIITPFKERALEEQRLKEALLLSVTPGLKRRLEIQASIEPLHNDPFEIRSYLRDLSSAIITQGSKNLYSKLDEERQHDKEDELNEAISPVKLDQDSSILKETFNEDLFERETPSQNNLQNESSSPLPYIPHDQILPSPELVSRESHSSRDKSAKTRTLTELLMSQLPTIRKGPKIRKLEPVNIKEVEVKQKSTETLITKKPLENPFIENSNFQQKPIEDDMPVDNMSIIDDNSIHESDNERELPFPEFSKASIPTQLHRSPVIKTRHALDAPNDSILNIIPNNYFSEDDDDSIMSYEPNIKPLSQSLLHTALNDFLNARNIKLSNKEWKRLQLESVDIMGDIISNLNNSDDQNSIDTILEISEKLNVSSSKDIFFQKCCNYLNLEQLNELERILYTGL
ncbi:hypothetical protein KAFR_0J00200 [Kazachstania africana CBS 2517]|uniref:Uncharacterized protein n=1 Tax=Kazachstania africana (strain ATCC 22294 / BCRC 22015 / CBS 2517 / CECT 1963 / NBRC 1671 / NRRL Y-8276) TaxID=1071382 RepID=H2B0D8_KAZAF|nr:hypothetical protein KAFR_0J00200 [Kazachstania africana CBS 2517]CCF60088.1 hypothetical protein KAFR_0J00200 [Kazachstania africana CBS 2517]